jgi:hypothetical protein
LNVGKAVSDEHNNKKKEEEAKGNIQLSIVSLQQLSSLETETLAAEIHLLGQMRDRLSPTARFADKILTKYHRKKQNTAEEYEHIDYLVEGFPFVERGKPLTGLLVIDKYSTVESDPEGNIVVPGGQYAGERLYLTHDRKWILAERVGAYSETTGASSEWEATCRIVTDRSLLERYSIDAITEGLFEATNKLWDKLSPRMEALKKRSLKAHQISSKLTQLKSLPKLRFDQPPTQPEPQKPAQEAAPAAPANKVRMIGHS